MHARCNCMALADECGGMARIKALTRLAGSFRALVIKTASVPAGRADKQIFPVSHGRISSITAQLQPARNRNSRGAPSAAGLAVCFH